MHIILIIIFAIPFFIWANYAVNEVSDNIDGHRRQQDQIAANQEKILRQQEEILRQQKENQANDEP